MAAFGVLRRGVLVHRHADGIFPLWLQARGLDAAWIGAVTAVPLLARLSAVPLATRLAERRHALKAALVICVAATAIGFVVLAQAEQRLAILLAFFALSCVWLPVLPLTDAYALRGLTHAQRTYGPVRLWGSSAFIVGTLAAGALIPQLGADRLVWLIVCAAALSVVAALALPGVDVKGRDEAHPAPPLPMAMLLRMPLVLGVTLGAALTQGSHAAYYTFSAIGWKSAGRGGPAW